MLGERMLLLYAGLISLQALYVAYVSGQGFEWPLLSEAGPLAALAWNVPAALSGAIACLFVREIAQLRRYLPRFHTIYAWLAGLFVFIAVANVADLYGHGRAVATLGNVTFLGTAVVTLTVAFVAWRRGSRSAGWFLLAWALLEAVTIATTAQLLLAKGDASDVLTYFGLPLSMVAAAVLIALGVADQLREQRRALTEAERHAQTDSLTGVLNRRSLLGRLEDACARARSGGMPVAVLFIDLDHFKRINDSFGHPAGDACLRAVVAPIHAELRQSDVIGRYGGEEFVVVLQSAGEEAARLIAERIVQRIATLRIEGFGPGIRLTASIGVAASDRLGVLGEALIARADAAVYAAKDAGRNRVEIAATDASPEPADEVAA
jgi:diguanylate cyclase (GGDEF)-like protein